MFLLFFLLLVAAAVALGFYSFQNVGGHPVNFLYWHWNSIPEWVPVLAAAVVFGGIMLLYLMWVGAVSGVRRGALRRRVVTHESTIGDLRGENQRLREENARLRSDLRQASATSRTEPVATTRAEPVGATETRGVGDYEQVPTAGGREGTTAGDERVAAADAGDERAGRQMEYRRQPTFGERVRGFFGRREPSGY